MDGAYLLRFSCFQDCSCPIRATRGQMLSLPAIDITIAVWVALVERMHRHAVESGTCSKWAFQLRRVNFLLINRVESPDNLRGTSSLPLCDHVQHVEWNTQACCSKLLYKVTVAQTQ